MGRRCIISVAQTSIGCVLALALLAFGCQRTESKDLPRLGTVPALSLQDHSGANVTAKLFKHKVSIVHFMFTSCPSVCPVLVQQVASLQRSLKAMRDKVQFISISVDPEVDTPERLQRYAKQRALDLTNWRFLTGDSLEIRRVVVQGFKQALGERRLIEDAGSTYDILHGTHLVLIDPRGVIRGFYRAEPQSLALLEAHVRMLFDTMR